jgi:general secretion pathway protein B
MSLILEAINRSQREAANPGEVPGIATQHYADPGVAPGGWPQALLLLALLVALAVIAWLLLGQRPAPAPAEPHPVPVPAPLSAAPVAAPRAELPVPAPGVAASGAGAGDVAGERATPRAPAVDPFTAAPPASAAPDGTALAQAVTGEPPAVAPEVAALYARPDPVEAAAPAAAPAPASSSDQRRQPASPAAPRASTAASREEPLDVEAMLQQAQAQMANQSLAKHPAPFLADLTQQRKDAIPTLLYAAHDYRGKGGESTVVINGRTAHAGESLGKGVTVEEILPDSVVLSHDGQQFRLRALNSWVNL